MTSQFSVGNVVELNLALGGQILRIGLKLYMVAEDKTQLMVFGSRPNLRKLPEFNVSFRDAVLQPCEQVGNLGVVFDGALSWEAHVSELSRRCTGLLIGLSHVRHCLPDGVIKIDQLQVEKKFCFIF